MKLRGDERIALIHTPRKGTATFPWWSPAPFYGVNVMSQAQGVITARVERSHLERRREKLKDLFGEIPVVNVL